MRRPTSSERREVFFANLCPSVPQFIEWAARIYGTTVAQINGNQRTTRVTRARHWAMYNAYRYGRCGRPEIARRMGGKDPSSVWWGIVRHAVRHGLDLTVEVAPDHSILKHPYEGPEPSLERPWRAGGRA